MKLETIGYGKKTEEGKIEEVGQVTLRVPESLDEAREMWGEDVVLSKAVSAVIIDAQRIARAAGTPDEAQAALDQWTPGVSRERAGGVSTTALAKKIKELGVDRIKELLAQAGVQL